ncbi:MAG: hypothetical protein D6692_06180 [Planctomycetota bacterium]|nr:MAG: hypothetical protein D6692_06180 [Planctomycetota bacterium]
MRQFCSFTVGIGILLTIGADPGCARKEDHVSPVRESHEESAGGVNSNVVAIPPSVRSNLGITFVGVERRRIEQTLRVPGRFEYLPTARRDYHAMLPGRVEFAVDQFDRVDVGDVLYWIDSPSWREHQEKMTDAFASIGKFRTRVASFEPLRASHRAHEAQLEETIAIRRERIRQLEGLAEAGGGRRPELIVARDALSTAEAELTEVLEKEATLEADEAEARADLAAAEARFEFLLEAASAILGQSADSLLVEEDGRPRWRTVSRIEVRAKAPGVVDRLGVTGGAWVTQDVPVVSVVRPEMLRFRASGLQSDLGLFRNGLAARVVPPNLTASPGLMSITEAMHGTLVLGLTADPEDRTIDLFITLGDIKAWAKAGVTAHAEIVTDESTDPVLAIPLSAVQRDGLTPVIFRRNPKNPDEVVRMEADLGSDDGRWVAILSGVREGDQIVLDGAFQLMLATSGSIQKGGHFHADGTFHEGED